MASAKIVISAEQISPFCAAADAGIFIRHRDSFLEREQQREDSWNTPIM